MERQIGDQFDFLGVKLEVVEKGEENSCVGCYFCGTQICVYECIINFLGSCASSDREDGKDVIFKKIE